MVKTSIFNIENAGSIPAKKINASSYGSVSGIGNAADCKSVVFRHSWFESKATHYGEIA